jgi:hypothetical protein
MDILEFWKKNWLIIDGLSTISMSDLKKRHRENTSQQKKYFLMKDHKKKWYPLTAQEQALDLWYVKIVW